MTREVEHRGPDAAGQYIAEESGVALGHRRLAILDLSADGSQPMESASGRFVLAFNGEIFNHRDLRRELSACYQFKGRSDTEVLLAAIEAWGLEAALSRCVGMFALAVWDVRSKILRLGRDRLGIKPLYYSFVGSTVIFGSELKALKSHPDFSPSLNREAIAGYARYSYVPAPLCIYNDVRKLPPGTTLTIASPAQRAAEPVAYWSPEDVVRTGEGAGRFKGTDEEAVEALTQLLGDAVQIRMMADVPLGAFLSGGIDSSLVVALMQAQSMERVKTYSIGMADSQLDETAHAQEVAARLGTAHTQFQITEQHAAALIPHLPSIYDEPFADSSQIPTYLVSALARKEVTVALSGDGGDEVFGGYNRHVVAPRLYSLMSHLPRGIRRLGSRAMRSCPESTVDRVAEALQRVLPPARRQAFVGAKLHKVSYALTASSPGEFYDAVRAIWPDPASIIPGVVPKPVGLQAMTGRGFASQMMCQDLVSYLPDDILTKVDRSSMAVALEARVPLLDHRVVEFAWTLPMHMKIRGGIGKWILREVLAKYIPPEVHNRPKSGFGIPIGAWLRGPLREWAEDMMAEEALKREGLVRPEAARRLWEEHVSGRGSHAHRLWNVLMLQAWAVEQRAHRPGPTLFQRGRLLSV